MSIPGPAVPHGRRTPGCCRIKEVCGCLLHLLLGLVSVARDYVVFQRMVFLILHFERLPFVIDELYADLAVRAVLFGIGWRVAQRVLIPDRIVDRPENIRHLTFKAGEKGISASHARERRELVVCLKVVNFVRPEHSPAGISRESRRLSCSD
jgi:hypothetical protein